MPTGPSPRPFPTFSLHPNCRHTSAHPRSLMPVLLPTHLTFPLHPHRLQKTTAHPRSLMPIGPSPDLFPTFPLHPTVRTRRRIHACSCPPALLPTHFPFPLHKLSAHPPRIHARSCPPVLLPTHFQRPFHPHPPHTSAHPRSCPPVLLPTPSAHVRPSTLAHAHGSFSLPISDFCLAPISNLFSLHPHRAHTSAHPRSLMPAGPSPNPFPTVPLHPHRSHTSAHPRSLMPTGTSPHVFNISLAPAPSAHVRASVPSTHFQPFPLHPFRLDTSVIHARSCPPVLLPTWPISNLSLAPAPSAHVCLSTLAHAHHSFSPPISNLSNFQLVPCTHTVRTRPRSTLAHAHWSFSPPFSIFSIAPTLSAHVRSSQVALCAVSRLNESPSIEDAFGKTVGLLEGKRCLKWGPLVLEVRRCLKWVVFWRVKWGLCQNECPPPLILWFSSSDWKQPTLWSQAYHSPKKWMMNHSDSKIMKCGSVSTPFVQSLHPSKRDGFISWRPGTDARQLAGHLHSGLGSWVALLSRRRRQPRLNETMSGCWFHGFFLGVTPSWLELWKTYFLDSKMM